MKKVIILAFAICLTSQIQAQIAVVNYMKVKPGNGDAFLANERIWKKLHQQRVNDGKIIAWEVFYVHGSGTNSPYNYATVDIYPDMNSALQGVSTEELKKVYGEKYADVLSKTNATRDLIYSDMFSRRFGVSGTGTEKFLRVSFMRSKSDNYFEMEEKAYMPFHKAAIDMGNLNSWSVWSRPFWNSMAFDAVTVNGFSSIEQMTKMNYGDEVFKKSTANLSPGELMEITNYMQKTDEIRDMTRSQLWELIESTTPKK